MNSEERSPRLKRLDQLFTSHPLYFVTANTESRKPILANIKVHDDFRKFCETGLERSIFVGKYVLMPDHLHLFVAFGDHRLSISDWMKSLKNSLSKILREMKIPAPHWQKGFFDHVMRSEESYSEKWIYVAENPVRKKLVARAEDWLFQGEIYPLQAHGHV